MIIFKLLMYYDKVYIDNTIFDSFKIFKEEFLIKSIYLFFNNFYIWFDI